MKRFMCALTTGILSLVVVCAAVASPIKPTPCDNSTWVENPVTVGMAAPGYSVATVYVRGYTRSNGTYVAPHTRSNPDGNPYNNYGY